MVAPGWRVHRAEAALQCRFRGGECPESTPRSHSSIASSGTALSARSQALSRERRGADVGLGERGSSAYLPLRTRRPRWTRRSKDTGRTQGCSMSEAGRATPYLTDLGESPQEAGSAWWGGAPPLSSSAPTRQGRDAG